MLGLWLSWSNNGQPRRNVIPGIVIILTGYAMSAHTQHSPLSGAVHTVFGYTLMAAGLARVVEIAFVCRDRSYLALEEVSSWQYLSPYLLFAAGFIFQAANEERKSSTPRRSYVKLNRCFRNCPGVEYRHRPRLIHPSPILLSFSHVPLYVPHSHPLSKKKG